MLSFIFAICLKLSEFCQSPTQYTSPIKIDDFDIPFDQCSLTNFANIEIITTYDSIKNYKYRTLRLDNQLKFTINDVISGDILTKLDILDSRVTLNIHPNTPSSTISGDIRINKANGSQLIINKGSFQANPQKLIRFIHTNDVHCAYMENPSTSTIGLSKFVSYVKMEKAAAEKNGYSVFSVDCGDFNQGLPLCNINNGSVGHEAIKLAKYDVFTLGNHEWDFGHHNLYEQYADFTSLGSPLVVSNVVDSSASERMVFTPYVVKEVSAFGRDGINGNAPTIKVGFFGLITPYTNVTTNPLEVKDIFFDPDVVALSQKYVKILRDSEKCDVVVLVCHLGYEQLDLTSNKVAESFDGIDVIIDGHSHTALQNGAVRLKNDFTTLIAQTGSSFQAVGVVDITVDSVTRKVVGKRARLLNYGEIERIGVKSDDETEKFLEEKQKEIEKITKVVIGKTLVELDCARSDVRLNGRSKMAYLATTAFLKKAAEADFVIANGGGLRRSISEGEITYGDVVSVLPFGNQIVVLNISGKQLSYLLRFGTRLYNREEYGGFPLVSGLSFTLNLNYDWSSESRITDLKIVGIDGKADTPIVVDDSHFYKLATIDFLYNGGDGYESIAGIPKLNQYSTELNAVIDFIKSLSDATITGNEDFFNYTRIKEVGEVKSSNKNIRKNVAPSFVYENSVEISDGVLNLINYNLFDKIQPLFNFTVKANSIIASDVRSIDAVLGESSKNLGFVGKNGIFVAADPNEFVAGKSINEDAKPISSLNSLPHCPFFNRLDSDGKCKIDVAFVSVFAVMLALAVISIVFIALFAVAKKPATIKHMIFNKSENPESDGKMQHMLDNDF